MAMASRAQRRAAKRQKPNWKCCSKNTVADTGRYSRGLHNHAATSGDIDHATGVGFKADASTTKAVLKRMKSLGVIE